MSGIIGERPFGRSGVVGAFASKGIDDNADDNALTIDSGGRGVFGNTSGGVSTNCMLRVRSDSDSNDILELRNNSNDTRVIFQCDGKVGINVASPTSQLHVQNSSDTAQNAIQLNNDNGRTNFHISQNSDGDANLELKSDNGSSTSTKVHIDSDGNTYFDGGNVGIGTGASPSYVFQVVGAAAKSTGTTWTDTSDERVKTNIKTIENGLDTINKLRPVSYNYTKEYLDLHPELSSSKKYNSFIAQEYKEVFPDAVNIGPDFKNDSGEVIVEGLMDFTPHDLFMYLVKAVQELSAKVTALESA